MYAAIVSRLVRVAGIMMILFVGLAVSYRMVVRQVAYRFCQPKIKAMRSLALKLPDAASQTRTRVVVNQVSDILRKNSWHKVLVLARWKFNLGSSGRLECRSDIYHLYPVVRT